VEKFARRLLVAGAALSLAVAASACGQAENTQSESSGGSSAEQGFKIALLLPESKTARYESADRPYIQDKIKQLCPKCEIIYHNANQDSAAQQAGAESALTKGAKVMILDAVDGKAAEGIVRKANEQKVPVIAYDRLASGPVEYYVSFNNEEVGKAQGQGLLDALKAKGDPKAGGVVMIHGDPADPNAADFKKGAKSVLDGQVNVIAEYDTPTWAPERAQSEMEQAITAAAGKKTKIIGVYSANDGMAGGIISALKAANITPLPPVTGQDAELAAIQRILVGDQAMTVYKAIKPEAEAAAEMAVAAGQGKTYDKATETKNNGTKDVKSLLLKPVVVTKANVKDTVVKDQFVKVSELCAGTYASACAAAGIS
jgi:D-xylose transport system substrate-binding protein